MRLEEIKIVGELFSLSILLAYTLAFVLNLLGIGLGLDLTLVLKVIFPIIVLTFLRFLVLLISRREEVVKKIKAFSFNFSKLKTVRGLSSVTLLIYLVLELIVQLITTFNLIIEGSYTEAYLDLPRKIIFLMVVILLITTSISSERDPKS